MRATEEIKISLPDGIDPETNNDIVYTQTINALSKGFRNSVRAKDKSKKRVSDIISVMTVKDINDLLFHDDVPDAPKRRYYFIIEHFLSTSYSYKKEFVHIVDGYSSIVSALQGRIQQLLMSGATHEDDEDNRTSTASYLDARLTSIFERTKLLDAIYRSFDDVDQQYENISKHIFEKDGLKSKVEEIDAKIGSLSKKADETKASSDQIMPNIISIMGVFSSVIVVILSLITTSSTWLSNANETNVLIAFVVPAGIITLAVCALTALVRSSIDIRNEPTKPDKTKHWLSRVFLAIGQFFQKWGLWLCIATVTVLIICSTTNYCQKTSDDQTHYIVKCLPASDFGDDSSTEGETQTTPGTLAQELFIVQEIVLPTGKVYPDKISCAEEDIHSDGFVYYCLLHQRFE